MLPKKVLNYLGGLLLVLIMSLQKDVLLEVESILLRDLIRDVCKKKIPVNIIRYFKQLLF